MTRHISLAAFAILMLHGLLAHGGKYDKRDVEASHVYTRVFDLPAGAVSFWTADLSSNGDTFMHLWNDSTGQQVAANDDYQGSLASRIDYVVPSAARYILVVRAYNNDTDGECKIYKDGNLVDETQFGGYTVYQDTLSTDIVQTVLVPGGTNDTVLFALDGVGNLLGMDDDSGVGYASKLPGRVMERILVATAGWTGGGARVIINDANNDKDGDGLGQQLEAALCTCDDSSSSPCGGQFDCGNVTYTHDTDGDGLYDDWEVLGIKDGTQDQDPQLLVKWGANPLRKDLFLQLNRVQDGSKLGALMTETQLGKAAALFRNLPSVQNLDGSQGFFLHVDRGAACNDPSLCGHWGHGDTIVTGPAINACYPVGPGSYFPSQRKGVFFSALGYQGGAGSTPVHQSKCITFGTDGADTAWATIAHEMSHALGLQHGGADGNDSPNGNPTYQSVTNYTYSYSFKGNHDAYYPYLQFSPGTLSDRDILDLDETDPAAPPSADLTFLTKFPFFYTVHSGNKVDWNRNGVLESST